MSALRRMRTWRLLLTCFGVIALLFAATKVVTWARGRTLHASIDRAMEDALTSAELISRMGRDLEGQRGLFDTHILERENVEMSRTEARLNALQRDFASASAAYSPLADDAEERRIWQSLQKDVSDVQPQIDELIALSRQNRDPEARQLLGTVDQRYVKVMDDVGRLATLNRVGVTRTLAALDSAQSELNLLVGGLALLGIALTALVGGGAMSLVHQREAQLMTQSALLEERNRELDAFAGRVAHDLRGPLTSMRLAVWRLVKLVPAGSAPSTQVDRAIERMDMLIKDLLSLSRIESRARDGSCDPASVAADVRDDLSLRMAEVSGTLEVAVEPAKVRCSEGLLTEALTNLTDNALKYRRPDEAPRVSMTGHPVGRHYELRIADNGIGMSIDERKQAFAPFYRAHREPTAPGSGLGLSIVKRIAEASGGDVSVDSALGQGTTFVLHLPLVDG